MHTVFALLCFVVVIRWLIFPYPPGLLHWHCGNLTIAPVPAKQPWWIWINTSCEFIMNDCITTTKQSTTKPCAYFLGYTVHESVWFTLNVTPSLSHVTGQERSTIGSHMFIICLVLSVQNMISAMLSSLSKSSPFIWFNTFKNLSITLLCSLLFKGWFNPLLGDWGLIHTLAHAQFTAFTI